MSQVAHSPKRHKCSQHLGSRIYRSLLDEHTKIITEYGREILEMEMDSPIMIQIAFHFLAPTGTFLPDRVTDRAEQITADLTEDFNHYSDLFNVAEHRYRHVIQQVFRGNPEKQAHYLSPELLARIPSVPSRISFRLGNVYYYPITKKIDLSQYQDLEQPDLILADLRKYIVHHHAGAMHPEQVLNIWVVDTIGTGVQGYSSLPWQAIDLVHGIILDRSAFFPEEDPKDPFSRYKSITHHLGHYLGLVHPECHSEQGNSARGSNLHQSDPPDFDSATDQAGPIVSQLLDPSDLRNEELHQNLKHNPAFSNYMSHSHDRYVTHFTREQIQKMRYIIRAYRPQLDDHLHPIVLAEPQYYPVASIPKRRTVRTKKDREPKRVRSPKPERIAQAEPSYSGTSADQDLLANIRASMSGDRPDQKSMMGHPNPISASQRTRATASVAPRLTASFDPRLYPTRSDRTSAAS